MTLRKAFWLTVAPTHTVCINKGGKLLRWLAFDTPSKGRGHEHTRLHEYRDLDDASFEPMRNAVGSCPTQILCHLQLVVRRWRK